MKKVPFYNLRNGSIFYLDQVEYLKVGTARSFEDLMNDQTGRTILGDYGVFIPEIAEPTNNRQKTVLFVEPHPDDLAFSCGGFLANSRTRHNITVLTVFTRGSLLTFPWRTRVNLSQEEYDALRAQESKFAIETYLGERNIVLELPLALRRDHATAFERLNRTDAQLGRDLESQIVKMCDELAPELIVGPLGIGGHVDHLICFNALLSLHQQGKIPKLILYEDMPYSRNKKKYFNRIQEVSQLVNLTEHPEEISMMLPVKAALGSIYKSQLDDFTYAQLLGCALADGRAVAEELASSDHNLKTDVGERVWVVK